MVIAKDNFLNGQLFLKIGDGKSKYCELQFIHVTVDEHKRTKKELANILKMYSSDRLKDLHSEFSNKE